MLETDLAWAAGFIDGEGCISIIQRYNGKGTGYIQTNVSVAQINKDPLIKLERMFGGHSRKAKQARNRRKSFVWTITSHGVYRLLTQILPYLVVKKNEAEFAIMYQRMIFSDKQKRLDAATIAERESLIAGIKEHHQTYEYDEDGD